MITYVSRSAELSADHVYRYELRRVWDSSKPIVAFCGLNPSTADAELDDATIRKEVGFAARWGYGGLIKVNAYAFRATEPKALRKASQRGLDPVGEGNDSFIAWAALEASLFVAAWGNHIETSREVTLLGKLLAQFLKVYALSVTGEDRPGHPLYLPNHFEPFLWKDFSLQASQKPTDHLVMNAATLIPTRYEALESFDTEGRPTLPPPPASVELEVAAMFPEAE